MVRGVLFDVDGTLVDSNYVHVLAWSRAFAAIGEQPPMALLHHFIGMPGAALVDAVLGREDQRVLDGHRRHLEILSPDVRAFPRAGELLRACAARDLVVVLATSGRPSEVEAWAGLLDADDAIAHVLHADDVEDGKPAPDVFTTALERAGLAPAEAVVVGDTTWDVEAADRAGVVAVGVRCGGIRAAALTGAGAVAVYDDPSDLLANLDASPLGRTPARPR